MDRFREMQAFVAVVDTGSFVGAGELLHVSKASISRVVMQLEARLGARLLQRTTRRLSLTEAGEAYYTRCRQILADLDEADGMVGDVTLQAGGRLRVNAPLSFGVTRLAALWPEFMRRHPGVELEVDLSDRLVDLVEEGYDMAIRITKPRDSSLIHRPLAKTRVLLCAAPDYLARCGTPAEVADLAQHEIIAYTYAPGGDTWHFATPAGEQSVTVRPRLRANNGETCRDAALAGLGITQQPDFLVLDHLAAGRLVELLPESCSRELGIYAVYPSRKHLSVKVRALADYLAGALAED
ncbi:MAG: LysR family transcriptional regulator [Thiobacillus sp.]|nr:LysR family transcriptional regulator [Thiobacillus sp.]